MNESENEIENENEKENESEKEPSRAEPSLAEPRRAETRTRGNHGEPWGISEINGKQLFGDYIILRVVGTKVAISLRRF